MITYKVKIERKLRNFWLEWKYNVEVEVYQDGKELYNHSTGLGMYERARSLKHAKRKALKCILKNHETLESGLALGLQIILEGSYEQVKHQLEQEQ